MAQKYNMELHAQGLIEILESVVPTCLRCPATQVGFIFYYDHKGKLPCTLCRTFVGVDPNIDPTKKGCPCNALGHKEAIKRTWIALDEGGYLDY